MIANGLSAKNFPRKIFTEKVAYIMNDQMKTVVVVAGLAAKAQEHGKLQDFIGYLIGAFAQSNTALLKFDENEACQVLSKLADCTLADCGEKSATLQ